MSLFIRLNLSLCVMLCFNGLTHAQKLRPGFDKHEFLELLKMNARIGDSERFKHIPTRKVFGEYIVHKLLDSITRGNYGFATIRSLVSVFAALQEVTPAGSRTMIPAKGTIKLSTGTTFEYAISDDPKAAVHAGWLISTAYIAKDVVQKIDSCYNAGIKDYFIVGHS